MTFHFEASEIANIEDRVALADSPEKKEAVLFLWLSLAESDLLKNASSNKVSKCIRVD
jgi:hypothetical protein